MDQSPRTQGGLHESVSHAAVVGGVPARGRRPQCDAGLSPRQFERRFADVLGISPKLYARIIRFEAAVRKRAFSSGVNWTTVAHDLGYHDQMHMIHDFQLLSGETPTSLALAPHLEYLSSIAAQPQM